MYTQNDLKHMLWLHDAPEMTSNTTITGKQSRFCFIFCNDIEQLEAAGEKRLCYVKYKITIATL